MGCVMNLDPRVQVHPHPPLPEMGAPADGPARIALVPVHRRRPGLRRVHHRTRGAQAPVRRRPYRPGLEFADFEAIERSAYGPQRRCRVFYCAPMRSRQKRSCEKNHELIRHIFPKRSDLDTLSQHDVVTVASHVNSYPRPSLDGRSPFATALRKVPKALLDGLGIRWIRADKVCLKPEVLKRRKWPSRREPRRPRRKPDTAPGRCVESCNKKTRRLA